MAEQPPIPEDSVSASGPESELDPISQLLRDIWTEPTIRKATFVDGVAIDPDEVDVLVGSPVPAVVDAHLQEPLPAVQSPNADTVLGSAAVLVSADAEAPGPIATDHPAADRSAGVRLGTRTVIAIVVALVLIASLLVWFGARTILGSSDGRLVTKISDSAAPGFEAVVDKTPTDLVLMVGDDGSLASAALLALTSDSRGGVMAIPVETDIYVSPGPGLVAPVALADHVADAGTEAGSMKVGELLNLSFSRVDILRPSEFAARLGGTPLTVNNPSAVIGADGTELFAKGSISLDASRVWTFLSTSSRGESTVSRAARTEAVWRALLARPQGGAGSSTDGLDRYLLALSSSDVTFSTLPVSEVSAGADGRRRVRLAEGVTGPAAIAPIVPLPEGAPGRRPRLRVLDATGKLDDARGAAVLLAAGGGQVDVIGNDRTFGGNVTQIVYFEPSEQDDAERMRAVLGLGEIVQSTQSNSALDITVSIGDDYLERSGPTKEASGG